jgi:hypothetical protein
MKATEAKLLEFLKNSPQFVIPIYQRTYGWGDRECRQLWEDILRTGRNDAISAHFLGSIVYVEKRLYQVTSQSPLLVIDGQQRLTTTRMATTLGAINQTSPNHLDLVDHLPHSFHADDRFLGKLLEIEARHLSPKEQSPSVKLAPEPLHCQMRLMKESMLGCFGGHLCIGRLVETHRNY